MKRVQIFLSERGTGILFTLIAILAINCWQLVLRNFDNDNAFSLAAAKNMAEGHGYSIKTASIHDLSKFYYDPLNRWPPGYSCLLVVARFFLNTDWIHASFILNALGLTALVLIFRFMLFQLDYPGWITNIAVLYFGFLLHPFHYSNYSDIFGLLFYLIGLSFLLRGVKSEKNITGLSLLSALSLGFSTYLKYLYLPLSIVPIAAFYIYGFCVKRKDFQNAAVKAFIFLALIICCLLLFQYLNSGHSLFINPSKTGFFPDQLFGIAPVIPAGVINLLFINMQLSILLHVSFIKLHFFWLVFYLFCLGWLAYTGFKLFRARILKIKDFKSFYAIQATMFTAVLFLYLLILTVTKNKHYQDTYFEWVYGQELRYYSVFIVFVLQYVVFLILRQDQFFGKFGKLFLRLSIGFAIMIEISHGVYFCLRAISFKKEFGTKVAADQFLYRSMEFTKKGSMESGNLVVCSNNYTIANMCSLENAPVFYELDKLNDQVKTSAPLTLLIAVDATVPGGLVPFLMHSRVKPDYVFEFVSYYIIHLPKNSNF